MRRFFLIGTKERLLVITTALVASIANLFSPIYYYFFYPHPPNTIYIGITHWYEDYFYYLSQLTQGAWGSWLVRNLFTTEAIPPNLNWTFNLLLGKIGGLFGLLPWNTYFLGVFVLTFAYVCLIYLVTYYLFPKAASLRLSSFLLALTSSGFYQIKATSQGVSILPYEYFYDYTNPFNRLGGVAHHLGQNICSILILLLFVKVINDLSKKDSWRRHRVWGWGAVTAGLLGLLFIINPVFVMVDGLILGIISISYYLCRRTQQSLVMLIVMAGVFILPILPLYLIQSSVFTHPYYQYFRQWEASMAPTDIKTFLLSTGIIAILAALGLYPYLGRLTLLRLAGLLLVVIPIGLYFSPLPRLLVLPNFRLMQPPAYIFLAAMAIEGLWWICRWLGTITKVVKPTGAFAGLMTIVLLWQLPVIGHNLYQKTHDYVMESALNYLDRGVYDGLLFLKQQPHGQAVVATGNREFFVPVVTGMTVYSAHRSLTYRYESKVAEVFKFYSLRFSPDEALQFLKDGNIGYVIWNTDQAGEYTKITTAYPFLRVLYRNNSVAILTAAKP